MVESSVRPDEIARFDALAATWWDPSGPMAPLHAMNPLRVGWIHDRLGSDRKPTPPFPPPDGHPSSPSPHSPLGRGGSVLDIGCGAGLASEALARLGHSVLGLDASGDLIRAAQTHAEGQNLPLAYRHGTAEALIAEGRRFAAVTALEVIEHVTDPAAFLRLLAQLVEPGGRLFISTLNRTARSLVVAKLGAEYIARLLPVGTHDWRRFVTPAELAGYARAAGFRPVATTGMTYDLRHRYWHASADYSVNYLSAFIRIA